MKVLRLALTLVLAVSGLGVQVAADELVEDRAADLAPPVPILASGKPIDVEGFAAPFAGDFDEDGKLDLMVGQYGMGRLRIYRNVGSSARPEFDTFDWFAAGGRITGVPTCCQVGFTPQLVDFDGDGRTDVLTGSGLAELYLFRRKPDGTFAEAEVLEDKHGEIRMGVYFPGTRRIRYNSTVFAQDWDGDGDADLLLGRRRYCLVPNEGPKEQPVFADAMPLECDGKPLPFGIVGPCVADWDGDGRSDLLLGRRRDIVWYRNVGSEQRPVLEKPKVLVAANDFSYGGPIPENEPAYYHAICVADFNADGRLDLLLGDECRERIEKELSAEETEQQQVARAKLLATRSAVLAEYRDLRDRPKDETRQQRIERYRQVLRKWQECPPYPSTGSFGKRHGRVWLYTRIAPNQLAGP